jgi:hypothetical protein
MFLNLYSVTYMQTVAKRDEQLYCQSSRKWYDLAPLFTRTNGVPTDRYNPNLVYNMRQSNPFWMQAISENNSCFESQKGLETVNHSVNGAADISHVLVELYYGLL